MIHNPYTPCLTDNLSPLETDDKSQAASPAGSRPLIVAIFSFEGVISELISFLRAQENLST